MCLCMYKGECEDQQKHNECSATYTCSQKAKFYTIDGTVYILRKLDLWLIMRTFNGITLTQDL